MDYAEFILLLENFCDQCSSGLQNATKQEREELWQDGKRINETLRSRAVYFPTRNDRYDAQQRVHEAFEKLKDAEHAARAEAREFAENSEALKNEIIDSLDEIKETGFLEKFLTGLLGDMISTLIDPDYDSALELLKNDREELKRLNRELKDVRDYFNSNRKSLIGRHQNEIKDKIREVKERLDNAWEALNKEWDELNEARNNARQEKTLQFIERQEERLEKLEGALERQKDRLTDLEDKLESARTEEFEDKVREWIKETEDRISDLTSKIEETRQKIDDAQSRLR